MIEQVIELFTDRHTCDLPDRHAQSVITLCDAMDNDIQKQGFNYKDLHRVASVLALFSQGIQEQRYELIPALERLLQVLRIPFEKCKSSDELVEVPKMPLVFDVLCNLILIEPTTDTQSELGQVWESLRTDIADTITEIANQGVQAIKDAEPSSEDKLLYGAEMALPLLRFFKNGNRNLKAFAESNVPITLCRLLTEEGVKRSSVNTMISVLEALTAISYYEPIAQQVVEIGVGRDLICIINESKDFRSYVVSLAIEALWNLIEVGGSVAISHLASYPEAIPSLKSQFDKVMMKGHKKDDKCLRNELCVLMNFIVSSAESHQYFMVEDDKGECILESMIKYAVYDEIQSSQPLFTQTEEDLELKKLLWTQVFQVLRGPLHKQANALAQQKGFFKVLLMFLDPKICSQNVIVSRWGQPQLIELQVHALNILGNLAANASQYLFELQGHITISNFLLTFSDKPRRKACMNALNLICKYEVFRFDMAILLDTLIAVVADSQAEGSLQLRELSLNILSGICSGQRENQKLFRRKNGIELLVKSLSYNEVDQSGNTTTFLVAVLDCISNAVFGNKRSEIHFLDIDGVQNLLNLVEETEYIIKRLALSNLCSILESPKSFKYFVEWNSKKTNINATQMLITLYAQEDLRFGVVIVDGLIKNTQRPLFPQVSFLKQKYGQDPNEPATPEAPLSDPDPERAETPSKSKASRILRMALTAAQKLTKKDKQNDSYMSQLLLSLVKTYDIRACVFATFFRVGFDLHELNQSEKQYMEMIQLYPYLKNGEIWQDIKQELDDLNVKPTSDDKNWMESAIEEMGEQTQQAVINQAKILQEVKAKQMDVLDNYFTAIRLKSQIQAGDANKTKKQKNKK